MARLLIADDHRLTVDGTVKLLWEEWPEMLTAFTVPDAIRQVDLHKPDLILLDLWFPGCGSSGFFVLEHCQRKQLPTRVLITSAFADPETVGWARERKAHGFIGKHQSAPRLIEAIRALLAGGESWPPPPEPDQNPALYLRPGHRRVLQCAAVGLTYPETATRLGLAEVTVEKYLKEARTRLGAKNTAHAVAIAERRGLFLLDPLPDDISSPRGATGELLEGNPAAKPAAGGGSARGRR
ncbi:MAG: response regulator [Gemmatimonadales bacterium]